MAYANEKYRNVRHAYQAWEDNKKEISIDQSLESAYTLLKVEFLRVLDLVKALANVLDHDLPIY